MSPPFKMKTAITVASEDHGRARHRRAARPAGRPHQDPHRRTSTIDLRVSTLPTIFGEKIVMRILDKSNLQIDLTQARLPNRGALAQLPERRSRARTAWCSSPAPPAPARRPRCTRRSTKINTTRLEHHDRRGPGRVQPRRHQPGARCTTRSGSPSPRRCGRSCARTRTSSWSARSATSRPRRSPSRPRSPATWCLSTLHTNDAPSTINRLIDMGIEPFLVSSSVLLIMAQRLVRRLCEKCKKPMELHPEVLRELGIMREPRRADPHGGDGLPGVQRHRLHGARGPLRGHADHRPRSAR